MILQLMGSYNEKESVSTQIGRSLSPHKGLYKEACISRMEHCSSALEHKVSKDQFVQVDRTIGTATMPRFNLFQLN
jgi:hypothetical protein